MHSQIPEKKSLCKSVVFTLALSYVHLRGKKERENKENDLSMDNKMRDNEYQTEDNHKNVHCKI